MASRSWTSPIATTHANGVAHTYSLSILAMNVYSKVWLHLLEHLPGIMIRAYIDDAYLWRRLQHAQSLQVALQVTEVWDQFSVPEAERLKVIHVAQFMLLVESN